MQTPASRRHDTAQAAREAARVGAIERTDSPEAIRADLRTLIAALLDGKAASHADAARIEAETGITRTSILERADIAGIGRDEIARWNAEIAAELRS